MASESVTTQPNPCRDPDHKVRADALHKAALGSNMVLWQIKAIAQLLNDHQAVQEVDFPDEISGGIGAILALATHESDDLFARL